ncbi:hypothetical protein H4582DRAFT_426758 [Lactarius indigo]|nr:hypothetical protein H4582DRAFT_426758 [Lactarius indigo]
MATTPRDRTTGSFMSSRRWPKSQRPRRSQAERLPTFEDRPNLTYINAVCKEILKWKSVAPLSIPHSTARRRLLLHPQGSILIPNSSAIFHDPAVYSDPDAF